MVAEDVRRVPMAQIEAAQTMGQPQRDRQAGDPAVGQAGAARHPAHHLWLGLTYLVVAELVAANSGLGYAILKAQRYMHTDKIFAGILLIGLIGLITDQAFRWLHRRAFPWMRK